VLKEPKESVVNHPLLQELKRDGRRITVKAHPAFHTRFLSEDFFVEYDPIVALGSLSPSTLAIPFILNVLPLIWISGETYTIDELDLDLTRAVEQIQKTFQWLHPSCAWNGKLIAARTIRHPEPASYERSAALFSGGVDSVYSALAHHNDLQLLVKILDTNRLSNESTTRLHAAVRAHVQSVAERLAVQSSCVVTNVPTFISPSKLADVWPRPQRWLIEIQHGMGFAGVVAPLMQALRIGHLYLSGCELDHYGLPSGTHPDIVNAIQWAGVQVSAYGVEKRRQQKLGTIWDTAHRADLFPVKPCLRPTHDYANCCTCSKCLQTIIGAIGEGIDPQHVGFDMSPADALLTLRTQITHTRLQMPDIGELLQWMDIQMAVRRMTLDADNLPSMLEGIDCEIAWFRNVDLPTYFARIHTKTRRIVRSMRARAALRLDTHPSFGRAVRKLLRPFLQWR